MLPRISCWNSTSIEEEPWLCNLNEWREKYSVLAETLLLTSHARKSPNKVIFENHRSIIHYIEKVVCVIPSTFSLKTCIISSTCLLQTTSSSCIHTTINRWLDTIMDAYKYSSKNIFHFMFWTLICLSKFKMLPAALLPMSLCCLVFVPFSCSKPLSLTPWITRFSYCRDLFCMDDHMYMQYKYEHKMDSHNYEVSMGPTKGKWFHANYFHYHYQVHDLSQFTTDANITTANRNYTCNDQIQEHYNGYHYQWDITEMPLSLLWEEADKTQNKWWELIGLS